MARKPNYAFERNARAKAKAAKREAKRQSKLEARASARAENEADEGTTGQSESEQKTGS